MVLRSLWQQHQIKTSEPDTSNSIQRIGSWQEDHVFLFCWRQKKDRKGLFICVLGLEVERI
jgi:hypothetical protein